MSPGVFFCSQAARDRNEQIFATAPEVEKWLLLEHPVAWSSKALPDELLPESVRKHIFALTRKTQRTRALMMRQGHSKRNELLFFSVQSGERKQSLLQFGLAHYEDLLRWDGSKEVERTLGKSGEKSLFLVCTHGKHDQCCAKYGHSSYCALRDIAGDAVWECSHVGGDRFAGNVICLPYGIYYGNVMAGDAPAFLAAHERGEISLKHYRGRSSYSRGAQAGEYFIRSESGILGIRDLVLIDSCTLERDRWRVRFAAANGSRTYEVEFTARETGERELLTCRAETPQPIKRYELASYRTYLG